MGRAAMEIIGVNHHCKERWDYFDTLRLEAMKSLLKTTRFKPRKLLKARSSMRFETFSGVFRRFYKVIGGLWSY